MLIFPAPHFLRYHLCDSMLSTVHCVYDYKMAGQPRSQHWEVLESRIMDVWQAGKKLGWVSSLIMRSVAFLGMIFSLDCAWRRNRRDLVIVVFCSRRHWGLHLALCLPRPVAVHLFIFLMIPFTDNLNKHLKTSALEIQCL